MKIGMFSVVVVAMDVQAEVNSLLSTGLLMLIVGVYKYSEVVLA
jgi:hypothetical protein